MLCGSGQLAGIAAVHDRGDSGAKLGKIGQLFGADEDLACAGVDERHDVVAGLETGHVEEGLELGVVTAQEAQDLVESRRRGLEEDAAKTRHLLAAEALLLAAESRRDVDADEKGKRQRRLHGGSECV